MPSCMEAQVVIKKISSSQHFSPGDPATHEPDMVVRDIIAIVRAIVVKVCLYHVRDPSAEY